MTKTQYQILSILAATDETFSDPSPETLRELSTLRAIGFVASDVTGDWYITDAGLTALSEAQQEAEKAAKEIAQKHAQEEKAESAEKRKERGEWMRFVLGLIIGWILGVISPLDVWGWIASLFH